MKILLLCNKSPWPPKDGGAAATLNLIRCLADSNEEVSVLSLNPSKHFTDQKNIPEEIRSLADFRLINNNARIKPVQLLLNLLFSQKPYNIERYNCHEFHLELQKMKMSDFDVIQIEGLAMHHYLTQIKNITSVPVVFRPHNIENRIWSGLCNEESNTIKKIYFRILAGRLRKIEKSIQNNFDAVIPITRKDRNWFIDMGLKKPSIVFSPAFKVIDRPEYVSVKKNAICFIGALDWLPNIKGLTWFIENVWPKVLEKVPSAEFYIAGRNASIKTISKLKGENIKFEGEVESSVQFLENKSIMVIPLFSGSGIRMKILEGMSLGKVIVATPLAAEGIEHEDGVNIFLCSGADSFADRIAYLLENEDLRNSARKNALRNVKENYNILASSDKLIKFYRELTA